MLFSFSLVLFASLTFCGLAKDTAAVRNKRNYYEEPFICATTEEYISQHCVCDGKIDCSDGSDEFGCEGESYCYPHFQCVTTGECVHAASQCDGKHDCADGSDEIYCGHPINSDPQADPSSPAPQSVTPPPCFGHQCGSGECLPLSFKCDGIPQCADGTDENPLVCGSVCQPNQWKCRHTQQCIDRRQVCDRIPQCSDRSDEVGCSLPPFRNQCVTHVEFACNNGQCIPRGCVCNGVPDCPDGSDEAMALCHVHG